MATRHRHDRIYQLYIPAEQEEVWVKLREKYQNRLAPKIRELVEEKLNEWLADDVEEELKQEKQLQLV